MTDCHQRPAAGCQGVELCQVDAGPALTDCRQQGYEEREAGNALVVALDVWWLGVLVVNSCIFSLFSF